MLFPFSWECSPARQPRWDFSGHDCWGCAVSKEQTELWEGAVPAPAAPPNAWPAPPRSRSCPSQTSSPRCCGCSLCFCSPLALSGELQGGPLQAHRASLRTSSQRHPAKKEENRWPKEPQPQTAHCSLLNTSGQGLCALRVSKNIQNMAAHLESPRKFSNYFKTEDYNILGAEHGIRSTPREEHTSPAESMGWRNLSKGWRNLPCWCQEQIHTWISPVPAVKTLWKMHLPTPLPGASWPWPPPRGLEGCTCNN